MRVCLQENERRLAGDDPRLCRPTRIPAAGAVCARRRQALAEPKALKPPANCEIAAYGQTSADFAVPKVSTMSRTLRPGDLTLVTGGSGFLGSAVVRALIERGVRGVRWFAPPARATTSAVSIARSWSATSPTASP